jgi:O-antigen ligase
MKALRKLYNEKIYFGLLLFVAVLIPNNESLPIRLASVSIILLSAWWLLTGHYQEKFERFKSNKLLWLFIAIYLINLPGLLLSTDINQGLEQLGRRLPLLFFPLVIGTSFRLTTRQINQLIMAFITGLFLMSLFTFREGILEVLDREDLTTMVRLTLLHRPFAGLFSAFAIVALVRFWNQYTSTRSRIVCLAGIAYFLFYIYVLYAKMAAIAMAVLCLLLLLVWAYYKLGKYVVLAAGMLFMLAGIWYITTNEQTKTVYDKIVRFEDFSYQEYDIHLVSSINIRYINWGCSIEVLKQDHNWLTGLGIGSPQAHLNLCYKDRNDWIYESQMNAHNDYLDEMLRNGVVGLLLLLSALAIPMVLALRQQHYTYFSMLVLFAVCIITENMLNRQAAIMFYALFNSAFAFYELNRSTKPELVHAQKQ